MTSSRVVCGACGEVNSDSRSTCWVCRAPLATPPEGNARRRAAPPVLDAAAIGCGLVALLIVLFVVTCFSSLRLG